MIISFENGKKIVRIKEYFESMSSIRFWLVRKNYERLCEWLDYREECFERYKEEKTQENKAELEYVREKVRNTLAIQRILEGTVDFSKNELRNWNIKRTAYMRYEYGIEFRRYDKWNTQDGHYMMKSY